MLILRSTDRWLLDFVFEPASRSFQRFTGLSTIYLSFGFFGASFVAALINARLFNYVDIFILALKMVTSRIVSRMYLLQKKNSSQNPTINSLQTEPAVVFLRIIWIIFTLTLIPLGLGYLKQWGFVPLPILYDLYDRILFICAVYFTCCSDFRPKKSTLSKWIGALRGAGNPSSKPAST